MAIDLGSITRVGDDCMLPKQAKTARHETERNQEQLALGSNDQRSFFFDHGSLVVLFEARIGYKKKERTDRIAALMIAANTHQDEAHSSLLSALLLVAAVLGITVKAHPGSLRANGAPSSRQTARGLCKLCV